MSFASDDEKVRKRPCSELQHNSWRRSRELLPIVYNTSVASFFSSSSHSPSSSSIHIVANLGRLLFVSSRAAFQLAPNLVLVLPMFFFLVVSP
jgi:hypothetical protein